KTGAYKRPIVTKTHTMKEPFYAAEAYHQDYAIKHPYQPYIAINDLPKVDNLKKMFPDVWRDQPVTVAEAEKANGPRPDGGETNEHQRAERHTPRADCVSAKFQANLGPTRQGARTKAQQHGS